MICFKIEAKLLNTRFKVICALCAAVCPILRAAESPPLGPLAYAVAPPCSKRPGVRAVRSDLLQLGDVTVSLSAQAAREGKSCLQSAALWVTRKGISQQFELRDAARSTFAILDIAPDVSTILLSAAATFPNPEDDHSTRMAVLSLTDDAIKWVSVANLLTYKDCDAALEPQGFLDATHILIAALPLTSFHPHASCLSKPTFFSFDVVHHNLKAAPFNSVRRFAQPVAGPVQSCKSDPDVVAGCYTKRARLSMSNNGESLFIWPVGERRLLTVEDGMLPGNLLSEVAPNTRVYATMVICPLTVEKARSRPHICIDSAINLHPEPVPARVRPALSNRLPR